MTAETYKSALRQAKTDLAEQIEILGRAQDCAEKAEMAIVGLRQTIAALQRLCGEPEFIEEDAIGLTDAIRIAFKTEGEGGMYGIGGGMSAQDVRTKMESMGYGGRWGNLLASIHTVVKRLHAKGELEAAGNLNGRETYRWRKEPREIRSLTPLTAITPGEQAMRAAMAPDPVLAALSPRRRVVPATHIGENTKKK